MSICDKVLTENRIATADAISPIAVFETDQPGAYHNVFADTVKSRREISFGFGVYEDTRTRRRIDVTLIGVYCGKKGVNEFRSDIAKD